jgi:hypothetical protein
MTTHFKIKDFQGMTYQEHVVHRAELLYWGSKDREFATAQVRLCDDNPLYFFCNYLWTYDPRTKEKDLPFIPYGFQELDLIPRTIEAIESGHDLVVEKPRDMGASFTILGLVLWGWRFRGWDFRIGSRKEDYVDMPNVMDALFPKIRYMLYKLPQWMAPPDYRAIRHDSHMKLINPEGGILVGEATNPNFGRGGRSNATIFDEFAAWQCDSLAWEGAADTTPCRIAISTLGVDVNCAFNSMRRKLIAEDSPNLVRLNWRQHPNKTDEWYQQEKERRGERDLAREVDCEESEAGGVVFGEFTTSDHGTTCPNPATLWRNGWTPREGLDPHDARPSVFSIVALKEKGGLTYALALRTFNLDSKSVDGTLEQIREIRQLMQYDTPDKIVLDAKYGVKKNKSGQTWEQMLSENDEPVELSFSNPGAVEFGHKIIRDFLRKDDGAPRLLIDLEGAELLVTSFQRYSYDEFGKVRENYKDPMDTLRYIITSGPPTPVFNLEQVKKIPSWTQMINASAPTPSVRGMRMNPTMEDKALEEGIFYGPSSQEMPSL